VSGANCTQSTSPNRKNINMNNTTNPSGIMASSSLSSLLQQVRSALGPTKALTLDEKLSQLTEAELKHLLQTARFVQFGMSLPNNHSKSYADVVMAMYPKMGSYRREMISEMLQDAAPVEAIGLTPKSEPDYESDVYSEWSSLQPTPDDKSALALEAALADVFPEQAKEQADILASPSSNADFLSRLTQSESSGDSNAEITVADGRRFVGKLQFGDARLQDYKKATGSSFTQDEFKADNALQDKVTAWHIADIDKTIDGLGLNTDGYDRDGLRAVAHLGGKHGMKKFVQSEGEYNPKDEFGTSLQSYYDKFSA
jgi:hypothetical protein